MIKTTTKRLTRPMMAITRDVLEAAKDAGATEYVAICRRFIAADRLGRRIDAAEWPLVLEAYEEMRAA